MFNTANDNIIPIHLVDTVCRLQSSEVWVYCWNGFVWTKSHAQVWSRCSALCARHCLTLCSASALAGELSVSCTPTSRDRLWYILVVWKIRNFKFSVFYFGISFRLFLPRLRGRCFLSPGVSVSAGKAWVRERPFLA